MASSSTTSSSSKVPGENVTDLEEIVRRWAGEVYEITKTKDQARIPKEAIVFNINWKQVKFHFDAPHYDLVPLLPSIGNGIGSTAHHGSPKHAFQPQTLFRTFFSNTTQQEQEYSFKTERCTRSTCTVCVETGFSRGFDFGIKLAVPGEVAEANAGFKRDVTVTNIGEDTVEEELIWSVDNTVKVPPNTETVAELVITEANCMADFRMETKFHGKVLITVTNLKENNSLVTVMEGNMADIMQREIQRGLKGFKVHGKVIVAETRGRCAFKYGIEQRVRISERALPPAAAVHNQSSVTTGAARMGSITGSGASGIIYGLSRQSPPGLVNNHGTTSSSTMTTTSTSTTYLSNGSEQQVALGGGQGGALKYPSLSRAF